MGCIGECSSFVVKVILFLFNLIILICAGLLIGVGVYAGRDDIGFDMSTIRIFTIVLGVAVAVIAFFGCCGVASNNSCLLTTYASILIGIFIIQLALAIYVFIAVKNGDGQFDNQITNHLTKLYENYSKNSESKLIVDQFQLGYQCCGLTGPTDSVVQNGTYLIASCCADKSATCSISSAFKDGCVSKVNNFIQGLYKTAGGVAIGFGILELVAAIFALCVRR